MNERPYGEVLDEMDHEAKYQPATVEQSIPMKLPNDSGLAEMLEATRAELRKAVGKIAKLEVEKSDLANMVLVYAYRAKHTDWSAPVAYITKAGLENWLRGDSPENHVLLRTEGELRVPLYVAPKQNPNALRLLQRSRLFVELASDIGDADDIEAAKLLLPEIDAALPQS